MEAKCPCLPSEYYQYSIIDDQKNWFEEFCNTLEKTITSRAADLSTESKMYQVAKGRNSIFIENSASESKGQQKECQKVKRHRWRFLQQNCGRQEFLSEEVTGAFFQTDVCVHCVEPITACGDLSEIGMH